MSKGVKKVIGVVAAVAVPFVAPAIATSIGVSSVIGSALGSATAGSVIGSAFTGAALGAATSALTGQKVGQGALFGAIGGGLGGYFNAPAAGASSAPSLAQPPTYSLTSTAPGTASAGLSTPVGFEGVTSGAYTPSTFDLSSASPVFEPNYSFAPSGVSYSPTPSGGYIADSFAPSGVSYSPTPLGGYIADSFAPSGVSYSPTPSGGYMADSLAPSRAFLSNPPASATKPTTFVEAVKQIPSKIADKFKDPEALADLTLRAAGQLAGSALAGDGLTDQERALLNAQAEELRMLQQTNRGLFEQKLQQAMNLIGEAKYFDPEYFGLQNARRAQIAGARAKAAGLRGLTGNARQAEARRYDLATSRDVGTAFDVGYNTGVQGRLNTMTAGLNAMPTGYEGTMSYYTPLWNAYAAADKARNERYDQIGALFGSLTGRSENRG